MSLTAQSGLWQRVVIAEMPTEAPHVFAAWARGLAQRWRFVERLIKDGQRTGEFRRGADAAVASRFILSALAHQALLHVHLGVRRIAPCDNDRLFDSSLDQWLHGLGRAASRRVASVITCHTHAVSSLFAPRCSDAVRCVRRAARRRRRRRAPPEVHVVTVAPERVVITTEWIATLDGFVNAQIRPQVSGYLLKRNYEEGAFVRKGQVLFEIDPRPFESVLAQARAQLGEAEAQLGKTERDLERDRPLAEQRAIARSQLDNDVQANLGAQAAVKSATAAVDTARAQCRLHESHVARRRRRGDCDGADRRSGRAGDAADDGVADRSDQGLLPAQRAGLPAGGRPDQRPRRQGVRGPAAPALTLILVRRHASIRAPDRSSPPIARSIAKTGTIRISATLPEPGSDPASRPVRPRPRRDARADRRAARPAARGHRAAGLLSGSRRRARTTR